MATKTRRGAKSEEDILAEAQRKKEILDKVAQSNLPTKTILKQLGISRSTYYSWLKRYEEEGFEGLLDSRAGQRPSEPPSAGTTASYEDTAAEPSAPPAETQPPSAQPTAAEGALPTTRTETARVEMEATDNKESTTMATSITPTPPGEEKPRRGLGFYGLIAAFLLLLGLLLSISLSNNNTYWFKKSGDTLTLWKGKFAPRGAEAVADFEPVAVGEADVTGLVGRKFTGREAAYKAIFTFLISQVDKEASKGQNADPAKLATLLAKAESVVTDGKAMAGARYQLAQKRVAAAMLGLLQAYQQALPAYEEALALRLDDPEALAARIAEMKAALSPPAAEEKEEKVEAEPARTTAEQPPAPATPEAPAESTAAAAPEQP